MLHLSKLLISRLWKLYEIDFVSAGIPAVKKHLRQHPVVMQCLMSDVCVTINKKKSLKLALLLIKLFAFKLNGGLH